MKELKPKTQCVLYARKSTEEDDKQVMSIEAQLFELREFAERERIEIVKEFTEAKSAKKPGREEFAKMLAMIETSRKPLGILAWHPDRLARNSVDGGKIIYLVDTGAITSLRFPQFWFEPTPQGKFMLQVAFGQSKYFSVVRRAERATAGLASLIPFKKGSREVYNYSTKTNFVGIDCSARRVRRAPQGKIRFCFRRKIPEFAPITI